MFLIIRVKCLRLRNRALCFFQCKLQLAVGFQRLNAPLQTAAILPTKAVWGCFAAGQALARECMRLTVQNVQNPMLGPAGRQPIVAAIQRGWLSGLSLDELESYVFSYARAAASLCDLEVMDQVIDECLILLPQDRLQEALATRKTIQELQDNLHCSIQRRDVAALCDAIVRCESYGWPSKRLEEAYVAKCQLQQLIARLRFAADAGDLEMLSRVVKECEGLGLPERDLKAAKQRKEQLEALSGQLQAAVEAKKLGKLNEALAAAQAGFLI